MTTGIPAIARPPVHRSSLDSFIVKKRLGLYRTQVNKDFTAGCEYAIPLKGTFRIYVCDKNDGGKQSVLHEATDRLSLFLEAGEGVLVRIEQTAAKPKLIAHRIL
jgi:hypothetical protein